ncbi:D-isomer specific 2-hydroxyacid dehydrogenase family protein [Corynebacterium sp. L4756]|uniref:D-isomer specific 2-hydroxyacid dehydrogenase family protein n=1 Tax=unclassified Corynebacterium TaxID=2624378 RepID=UPI00374D7EFF
MKYFMAPHFWPQMKADIDAAGHKQVEAIENAQVYINTTVAADEVPVMPDNIEFVQHCFAGVNQMIAAGHLSETSIPWCNAAGAFAKPVAESALGLLLSQAHHHKRFALEASWDGKQAIDESQAWLYSPESQLKKRVAIFGAGGIGQELISMLAPFGVHITAVNRSGRKVTGADETFALDDAAEVWSSADFVVLIMPLTKETEGLVDAEKFKQMKNTAILVNVGRGKLVNTDDLVDALRTGEIAGVGLEVMDPEPLPDGHPLYELKNCTMTPHIGASWQVADLHMGAIFNANAQAWSKGQPLPTHVDPKAGY